MHEGASGGSTVEDRTGREGHGAGLTFRLAFDAVEEEASVDRRSIAKRVVERASEAGSTFVTALEEGDDDRSIDEPAEGSGRKRGSIFNAEEDVDDCELIEAVEGSTHELTLSFNSEEEGSAGAPTSPFGIEEGSSSEAWPLATHPPAARQCLRHIRRWHWRPSLVTKHPDWWQATPIFSCPPTG